MRDVLNSTVFCVYSSVVQVIQFKAVISRWSWNKFLKLERTDKWDALKYSCLLVNKMEAIFYNTFLLWYILYV